MFFQQVIKVKEAELWLEGPVGGDKSLPNLVRSSRFLLLGQHAQER
jgi:hypothetical protein